MIREAVQAYGQTIDRTFAHDRTQTVGASEIGLCARKIHWLKKSGARDADYVSSWGAHIRGTVMEKTFWEPAMRAAYGGGLVLAGDRQATLESNFLSATPDGIVTGVPRDALASLDVPDIEADCLVVECKTVDPRVSLTEERASNHYQVQVQMGLIRERTPYRPMWAVISYLDASFWDEVDEFPVRFDEGIYESAQLRAQRILTAADPKELKPEGWIAGGRECEHCPFTRACGVIRRSVPEREAAADPQFVAEVADLCRDLNAAQQSVKSTEEEVRDIQQQIKDRLREKSVRKIPGVVTWSTVKGRTSYDMKSIREAAVAAGVDVEQFSTAGEPTDRLQLGASISVRVAE